MRGILAVLVVFGLMLHLSPALAAPSGSGTKRGPSKSAPAAKRSKGKASQTAKVVKGKVKGKANIPKGKNTNPHKSAKSVPKLQQQAPAKSDSPNPPPATVPDDSYTSLTIDATGLKLDKSMGPKILRKDGSEVWGTLKDLKDEDYAILEDRGMVGYVLTVEEAKANSRCGLRPLVVKAVETRGAKQLTDPVVSDEDAELIKTGNAKGKFLEKFNVIFIQNATPQPPTPNP